MKADSFLQGLWYQERSRWLLVFLVPLALLFGLIATTRRLAYRLRLFRVHRVTRPVIVVGNITVGGTGKTPFVIWLAEHLQQQGRRVGIVLRGYGGSSAQWPRDVNAYTPANEVGDEAVLHATRTGAIVVAGPDRVAAAARAIELGAEVIVCDDGLQHYRLARDCEIVVVDAQRALGNRWLLPAGPLREPASRIGSVDMVVLTQRAVLPTAPLSALKESIATRAQLGHAVSLVTGESRPLSSFADAPAHAVAGIGNPGAFFDSLRALGLSVDARALADHAALSKADIDFGDRAPVLMTEKDAVKCRGFADERHWAVRLDLIVDANDVARIDRLLASVMRGPAGKR